MQLFYAAECVTFEACVSVVVLNATASDDVAVGEVVLGDVAVSSVLDPYPYFICKQRPCGSICGSGSGATK